MIGLFCLRRNKIPWQPSDAPRHTKKANTAAKKSKWAKIANSVLSDCLKAGGSQKTCEGKAVRIANSKLEEVNMGWTDEDIKRHNEYFEQVDKLAALYPDDELKFQEEIEKLAWHTPK